MNILFRFMVIIFCFSVLIQLIRFNNDVKLNELMDIINNCEYMGIMYSEDYITLSCLHARLKGYEPDECINLYFPFVKRINRYYFVQCLSL